MKGKRKGAYTHGYDPDRLRQMIKENWSANEIMRALKISRYTLYEHLLLLQDEDNKLYEVPGLFDPQEGGAHRKVGYKREGVVFSEGMLQHSGFKPGDTFEMIVEEDRIILKKL